MRRLARITALPFRKMARLIHGDSVRHTKRAKAKTMKSKSPDKSITRPSGESTSFGRGLEANSVSWLVWRTRANWGTESTDIDFKLDHFDSKYWRLGMKFSSGALLYIIYF